MWIDLEVGILQEFQEAAQLAYVRRRTIGIAAWLVARRFKCREYERTYDEKRKFRWRVERLKRYAQRRCRDCGLPVPLNARGGLFQRCDFCRRYRAAETARARRAVHPEAPRVRRDRPRHDSMQSTCAECSATFHTRVKGQRFCQKICGVRMKSRNARARARAAMPQPGTLTDKEIK